MLLVGVAQAGAQQPLTRQLPADPDASIRIFNLVGSTHVTGWDADSVRVVARVPSGAGRFFIGGTGRSMKLGVETGNQLDAPGATLEILVPRRARVWVKSATASIQVDGVSGALDLASVSGTIRVTGEPGLITVESMDGAIELDAVAAVTRAKTADGAITIRKGGGDLTVSSVSGPISVHAARDVIAGQVESVTGRVSFDGPVGRDGTLDLQTHQAPIHISLPEQQSATIDVVAFSGKIMSGFPAARRTAAEGQPVRYVLGEGSAHVSVRSLKGSVTIARQDFGRSNAP